MLETIIVILVVLWLLGLLTSYTMGGLIHVLLVIAVVVLLVRIIQGFKVGACSDFDVAASSAAQGKAPACLCRIGLDVR